MIKELGPGFRLTLVFTVLTGLLYPAVMTAISEAIFPKQANGSLVMVNNKVVGSSLIGQNFSKPEYFHPRPSSAGNGYDATASSGCRKWLFHSSARAAFCRMPIFGQDFVN